MHPPDQHFHPTRARMKEVHWGARTYLGKIWRRDPEKNPDPVATRHSAASTLRSKPEIQAQLAQKNMVRQAGADPPTQSRQP